LGHAVGVVILTIVNCTHSSIYIHDLVISVNILKEAKLSHHFEVCALVIVLRGREIVFIHDVFEFVGARAGQIPLLGVIVGVVVGVVDA